MPVYKIAAHQRYDPEKKTVVFATVRASNPEEAREKITVLDLVDVRIQEIRGFKKFLAWLKADIKYIPHKKGGLWSQSMEPELFRQVLKRGSPSHEGLPFPSSPNQQTNLSAY